MKNFLCLLFLLVFSSLGAFAQTPVATPPDDGDVVKISSTLIQVDVTVTDKKGNIVTDLKPEDFEVYENKKKQNISSFSFVSVDSPVKAPAVAREVKKNQSSILVPPVPLRAEQVRRTIALVVDDLGLSAESIYFVRRSLKKFVDEQMQPNDLVAVIRTGGGIGATQQFTTDKRQLYAAIENVKWNSRGRSEANPFMAPLLTAAEEAKAKGINVSDERIAAEQNAMRNADTFREDIFAIGTLGAINFIVKGMGELPGRKSVMLFSDGFRISPTTSPGKMPDISDNVQRDAGAAAKLKQALKRLTDIANRASVIINTFDARGLVNIDAYYGLSPDIVKNALYNNQEGLKFLAKETGGQTFFQNNDMNQGIDEALEDQKGFYLLAYQPDEESFDPKTQRFNEFEIKVRRPGINVRYRSGFFGVSTIKSAPIENTPTAQLLKAVASPFSAGDISLRLNTIFGNSPKDGTFVHSFLHIDTKELKFSDEPDGWKKAVFDVLAISFGENGVPVDQISKIYTLRLKGETYQRIAKEGFVYNFLFPIKNPGAYQMRVAVRDTTTSKVGSANQFIEVPNLKKGRVTLSGIMLENFTEQQWANTVAQAQTDPTVDAMVNTSLRKFKKGTILRYGTNIYNAKTDPAGKPNLQVQMKIFQDGKPILEGNSQNISDASPENAEINFVGALVLGEEMKAGDYVLQVIATDALSKEKQKITTQWIEFEIVE